MKLLFDQNISRKLVKLLEAYFPESFHVSQVELETASDLEIWNYAKTHSFTIVTQDSDFSDLVSLFGFPPKVIWLSLGNVSTNNIFLSFRERQESVIAFGDDSEKGCLVIQ